MNLLSYCSQQPYKTDRTFIPILKIWQQRQLGNLPTIGKWSRQDSNSSHLGPASLLITSGLNGLAKRGAHLV